MAPKDCNRNPEQISPFKTPLRFCQFQTKDSFLKFSNLNIAFRPLFYRREQDHNRVKSPRTHAFFELFNPRINWRKPQTSHGHPKYQQVTQFLQSGKLNAHET
jgi:hypothetical protein